MAYVTRYIFGTDKLRPNSFEVRGMNGSNSGVVTVADPALLSRWIKLVTDYVNALNAYKVIVTSLLGGSRRKTDANFMSVRVQTLSRLQSFCHLLNHQSSSSRLSRERSSTGSSLRLSRSPT